MLFPLQNIPTLGTVAITMALHNCDEVAVAGFGYDMNTPHAPLHYYETVKMSAIKEVPVFCCIQIHWKWVLEWCFLSLSTCVKELEK